MPNSLAALDLRGLMLASVRLEGSWDTGIKRRMRYNVFSSGKTVIFVCVFNSVFVRILFIFAISSKDENSDR